MSEATNATDTIDSALASLLRAHCPRVAPSTEVTKVTSDLPRVVYTLIDTDRLDSDDGPSSLATATYQLDIFAARASDARSLADAIRVALNGRGPELASSPRIERITLRGDRFVPGQRAEGENAVVARFSFDVTVTYREQIAV
jgi:hypothetical protein